MVGLARLQEEHEIFAELFSGMGVGDATLSHHTRLLGCCCAGFLLGGSCNWFIAYLVSGDDGDDFSSSSDELSKTPAAHRVGAG